MVSNGRSFKPRMRSNDLQELSSEPARRDMTALMIGRMFKQTTGSDELLMETAMAIGDDADRWQAVSGTLLNIFYAYVTGNGKDEFRWKEIVDHLCSTLNVGPPEE